MKKVLGLDLGTTSIGWALVNEASNENEKSSIIKLGVRVNPLTVDEQQNFEKGKSITTNADRTLKRSMRRNLQRYKLRRENLIEILKENGFISDESILSENGNRTTFETYRLRAKAATEEISLEQFARVLLMINKKRGYKSSRKAKGTEDGTLIDGMEVAKKLYEENITPGQYCLQLLQSSKKYLPDFYRSDLQNEFDKIWAKQKEFYSFLTDELKENLRGKNEKATWVIAASHFIWTETKKIWNSDEGKNEDVIKECKLVGIKRETKQAEQKLENFQWRAKALSGKMHPEELIIVLQKINGQISGSSGYLGAISDRSKELYFNKQTVGQYQMAVLAESPNASLRNMVFYRQNYLDEFNTIWEKQAEFHKELTEDLRKIIRDGKMCDGKMKGGIFFQRQLKSQKGLISFCEFESRQIEVEIDGKKKKKTTGSRVIPRSSPLFQEFKIWQQLNDVEVFPANEKNKRRKPNARLLEQNEKELLFMELSIREKLSKNQVLTLLDLPEFDMNFNSIDGNKTQYELFKAYKKIIELLERKIDDDCSVETIETIFKDMGINTEILYFDSQKPLDEQPMYKLYHLLYSFEGDKSNTGVENLIIKLKELYGFEKDYAKILTSVGFQSDYGSLSAKAIRKILPLMKMGQNYTDACANIYERHSKSSLTTEELEKKVYVDKLEILPKNSLRNPVVEKILNQMVNVIDLIIDTYGRKDENGNVIEKPFDEIRIELARDLKKNANERFLLTDNVSTNTTDVERIKKRLKEDFSIFKNIEPTRKDIIRYKLWEELAPNAHKPLYGSKENLQKEISPAILFTKEIEIEHILPKARLFDDSFSNKTLVFSSDNKDKTDMTAIDYVKTKEDSLEDYLNRIISVCGTKTIKKVNTNTKTKKKWVETETATFDKLFKKHDDSLKKSKKHKTSIEKWNNANEIERKKLVKPWGLMNDVEKKIEVINKYYSNKLKKLVITASELPEGFINRDLANTQYITKKAKEMLGDLVKFVISTTGSITERLREDWQLVDVMKEINFPKYEQLGLVENEERIDYETGEVRYVKKIKDWTKRNDHRHHAMDALTVAFTKRQFIQYLNNLNARRTDEQLTISNTEKEEQDSFAITTEDMVFNTKDVLGIEKKELYRDKKGKLRFIPPMPLNEFRAEAKKHLENTLISIKAKNKVVTTNINTTKKNGGTNKKAQQTPRGQLHKETIDGLNYCSRIEVSKKISKEEIEKIRYPKLRQFIKDYIKQKGSIEKAFTETEFNKLRVYRKNKKTSWIPKIFTEEELQHFQYENKPLKEIIVNIPCFTERIDVAKTFTDAQKKDSAKEKILESVLDLKVREILQVRLQEYNGDFKKAFSNLEENPIWYKEVKDGNGQIDKTKSICIKRVIVTGIATGEPLHEKKGKDGNVILDSEGKKIPVDFVNTGNNHHVAVYRKSALDKKGEVVREENGEIKYELEENVISFYDAVKLKNHGLPIIIKDTKDIWDKVILKGIDDQSLLQKLPKEGLEFLFSMKQNEYFVFPNEKTGFNPKEIDLLNPDNYSLISPNLYRVQKLATKNYFFRHHLETDVQERKPLKDIAYKPQLGLKAIKDIVKVRVNHIGQIVSVGEY